jgi:hypothetical protein
MEPLRHLAAATSTEWGAFAWLPTRAESSRDDLADAMSLLRQAHEQHSEGRKGQENQSRSKANNRVGLHDFPH